MGRRRKGSVVREGDLWRASVPASAERGTKKRISLLLRTERAAWAWAEAAVAAIDRGEAPPPKERFAAADSPAPDGHASYAVGVARYAGPDRVGSLDPGTRLVCVRNSWGREWGVDGYALLTDAAANSTLIAAFAVSL